ncbi:MAG: 2-oxo acid dehydrogenase subunit E2 [Armatimonadetes bacterium]|nr:2-oxo acid dehydrogenase subunit E2 [Armatimonadota bacterium]
MATKVIMPKMGYDMEQGKIVRWLKGEGEPVRRGEDVAEIETEKVNIAIQAYGEGVLRERLAAEGETVPVGEMIAVIGQPDEKIDLEALRRQAPEEGQIAEGAVGAGEGREAVPEVAPAGPKAVAVAEGKAPPPVGAPSGPQPAPDGERLKITPVASRIAAEKGIDVRQVQGTGPGGRITRDDVLRHAERAPSRPAAAPRAAAAPAPSRPEEARVPVELSPMRQTIARRMVQSKREAPHFYVTIEVEMSEAMRLRGMLNEMADEASQVTVNDLILKAVAKALPDHREFNAHLLPDRLEQRADVNIGIAVALPEGLVAPAILHCEEKSLAQIARASKDVIARAKSGGLHAEEYAEATFTISNLGMFGVENFTAIIVPPQVAILAVGSVKPTAVVRDGQITIAQVMKATLSADHRAVDGAQAARLLQDVRKYLQSPMSLLL